jgi:hypothetical protein
MKMKKNILYSLIALMGLFAACKKGNDPKPVDPIVDADPYKHSRPIEVAGDDGTISKYSYNSANQIVKMEYYQKNSSGTSTLYSTQTYAYTNGKVSQLVLDRGTTIKYITDYKYQGNTDIIESTVSSTIDYTKPTQPITTLSSGQDYSYADGKILKIATKDDKNVVVSIRTYTFSMKGENPFVKVDYVPQAVYGMPANPAFNATTEYYKDVIDPVSYFTANSASESKFMPKNGTFSPSPNSTYTQMYELDKLGRIKTLSTTYTVTNSTIKTTYTYESY